MQNTTIDLPEITKDHLANREIIRANSSRDGEEIYKIPLDKIQIRDLFNCRQDYGDIEELADSIEANGQVQAGRVDALASGFFAVTDGHRRIEALRIIAKRYPDQPPPYFRAVVNNNKTTEEMRILQMFLTQQQKPLSDNEVADCFKRLVHFGYDTAEISRRTGKKYQYVATMLEFSNESPAIREQVNTGKLKVTTALALKKVIPNTLDRIEAVQTAVASNPTKTKVTVQDITGPTLNSWNEMKKVLKSINSVDVAGSKIKFYDIMMDILENKKDQLQLENFLLND